MGKTTAANGLAEWASTPARFPTAGMSSKAGYGRVVAAHVAHGPSEVSLHVGEIVTVVSKGDDGTWTVRTLVVCVSSVVAQQTQQRLVWGVLFIAAPLAPHPYVFLIFALKVILCASLKPRSWQALGFQR